MVHCNGKKVLAVEFFQQPLHARSLQLENCIPLKSTNSGQKKQCQLLFSSLSRLTGNRLDFKSNKIDNVITVKCSNVCKEGFQLKGTLFQFSFGLKVAKPGIA